MPRIPFWAQLCAFRSSDKGSVALIFGLSLVPVVLAAGISIDYARALNARQQLRNAADTAAVAGASIPPNADQSRETAARAAFNANIEQTSLAGVEAYIETSGEEVLIRATYAMPTTFTSIAGIHTVPLEITTRARRKMGEGIVCLLALNPTASDALHLQGSNEKIAENCWAWINSSSSASINAVGASSGQAEGYCTDGGVSGAAHFTPAPRTGCGKLDDPFASKFASYVPPGGCNATNLELKKGTHVLQPGVYCGGISLKAHADVQFEPGVYVIKDGVLQVQAQSSATGTGVAFYFTGNGAQLEVRGGGDIDFKAPAEGEELAGFVFVQDPSSNPGSSTAIQGGGRVHLEGILYMPTWRVEIAGNGAINQDSKYFAMVADSFYMRGNGRLYISLDPEAVNLPQLMPRTPGDVRLIE